jgi:hypothetical protein
MHMWLLVLLVTMPTELLRRRKKVVHIKSEVTSQQLPRRYRTTEAMQAMRNVTLRLFRATTVAMVKKKIIRYSQCAFVASDIQHVMRKCHAVICCLTGLTIFSTSSHKQHDFRGEKSYWTWNVCVLILPTIFFSETFLILRRNGRDMIKIFYIGLHVKYPVFLWYFNKTWILSAVFSKNTHIPNLMKIRPVGAELFHADDRTEELTDRYDDTFGILLTCLKVTDSLRQDSWCMDRDLNREPIGRKRYCQPTSRYIRCSTLFYFRLSYGQCLLAQLSS